MIGKGFIQIYTGTGKGKTTAALGLLLRAYGAGLKIFLGQFLKSRRHSELEAIGKCFSDRVTVRQYGTGRFVRGNPTDEDREMAARGLAEVREEMPSGGYDLVILDEINVAVRYGLVSVEDVLDLMEKKPEGVEMILTGRGADPRLIERADLVTEMREVKHYFSCGVEARTGIEK